MTVNIEKLRQVMNEVAAEKGQFTLFGLFLREDAPDKWDLVVAAPWLEEGKLKALGEFAAKLAAVLGEQEVLSLSRIVTVNHDNPGLDAILTAVHIEGGRPMEVKESNFFGLAIKDAYIFRAARQEDPGAAATGRLPAPPA